MGALAHLPLAYAFLVAYVPSVLLPLKSTGAKLVAVLPALAVCLYTPSLVDSCLSRAVIGCITMWLSSFKLIAFVGNRGPIAREDLTALQRTLLLLLPVHPRSPRWGKPPSLGWIATDLVAKAALQAAVMVALSRSAGLAPFFVHCLWALSLWNLVAMAVDVAAPFMQVLVGMPLSPSMDQPYLSVTVQEFWSRRYNLVTTTCLRQTVYEPIIERRFVRPHAAAAAAPPATAAAAAAAVAAAGAAACGSRGQQRGSVMPAEGPGGSQGCPQDRVGDKGKGSPAGAQQAAGSESASDSNSSSAASSGTSAGTGGELPDASGGRGGAADASGPLRLRRLLPTSPAAAARGGPLALDARGQPPRAGAGRAGQAGRSGSPAAPEWLKSAGTLAVFTASGVMHEAIVWYMCHAPSSGAGGRGRYTPGPVLLFFILQAPALQVEKWILRGTRRLLRGKPRHDGTPTTADADGGPACRGAQPSACVTPSGASWPASLAPPALPPRTLRAAAGSLAAGALHVVCYAARVIIVVGWLWGLADFTFWRSTQACHLDRRVFPEIVLAVNSVKRGALRAWVAPGG